MPRVVEQACECKMDRDEVGWHDDGLPHCPECDTPFKVRKGDCDALDGHLRFMEF